MTTATLDPAAVRSVLAEYRRNRRFWQPWDAAREVKVSAACVIATEAIAGREVRPSDAARYAAADRIADEIANRYEAQAERRGCPAYASWWFHGGR